MFTEVAGPANTDEDPDYKEVLKDHRVHLMKDIHVNEMLLAQLEQYRIITSERLHQIRAMRPRVEKVAAILDEVIDADDRDYFINFLWALKEREHEFLLPCLLGGRDLPARVPLRPRFDEGVRQHCSSYRQNLLKTPLFDFSMHRSIDVEKFYIKMDMDATCGHTNNRQVSVQEEEIFAELHGLPRPRTVLVHAPPGAGKSTFLRKYAHGWGGSVLEGSQTNWKLVVLVPAVSVPVHSPVRSTTTPFGEEPACEEVVWTAVRRALCCGTRLKPHLMDWLATDGRGALILLDGIDEVSDPRIIWQIADFLATCRDRAEGPCVMASSRTGLCSVNVSRFHRILSLNGFTLLQGVAYVNKYYQQTLDVPDHRLVSFVNDHREQLRHVLTNPLRTLIMSVLTADGILQLSSGQQLRTARLLRCLEEYIRRRQVEKTAGRGLQQQGGAHFYRMALQGLLTQTRYFPEDLLLEFGVLANSPYRAFLLACPSLDDCANEPTIYRFTHEMFFEYFSVRALETLDRSTIGLLLLWLCHSRQSRNIRRILFSYVAEYHDGYVHLLNKMFRATLVLQTTGPALELESGEDDRHQVATLIKEVKETTRELISAVNFSELLRSLPSAPQAPRNPDSSGTGEEYPQKRPPNLAGESLQKVCSKAAGNVATVQGQARKEELNGAANDVMDKINDLFEKHSASLQAAGWFFTMTVQRQNYTAMKDINDCLTECRDDQHRHLVVDTIHRLLPSKGEDKHGCHTIYGCDERWARVEEQRSALSVTLRAWLPKDACHAWQQHVRSYHKVSQTSLHSPAANCEAVANSNSGKNSLDAHSTGHTFSNTDCKPPSNSGGKSLVAHSTGHPSSDADCKLLSNNDRESKDTYSTGHHSSDPKCKPLTTSGEEFQGALSTGHRSTDVDWKPLSDNCEPLREPFEHDGFEPKEIVSALDGRGSWVAQDDSDVVLLRRNVLYSEEVPSNVPEVPDSPISQSARQSGLKRTVVKVKNALSRPLPKPKVAVCLSSPSRQCRRCFAEGHVVLKGYKKLPDGGTTSSNPVDSWVFETPSKQKVKPGPQIQNLQGSEDGGASGNAEQAEGPGLLCGAASQADDRKRHLQRLCIYIPNMHPTYYGLWGTPPPEYFNPRHWEALLQVLSSTVTTSELTFVTNRGTPLGGLLQALLQPPLCRLLVPGGKIKVTKGTVDLQELWEWITHYTNQRESTSICLVDVEVLLPSDMTNDAKKKMMKGVSEAGVLRSAVWRERRESALSNLSRLSLLSLESNNSNGVGREAA